jgi:hypothetical protein
MVYSTASVAFIIFGLLVGILLMLEIGRRIGRKRRKGDPEGATAGLGTVDGAVFGLIGLLMAFTFSAAASRFDARRHLVVEEANAIGTAYLRLDLLPAAAQPKLREDFRRYVDSRLAIYRALPDIEAAKALLVQSTAIQGEIWTQAVAACKAADVNGNAVTSLVLAALNEMIDITTTRTVAGQTHLPPVIFAMLCLMVLAGSLLAGFGMASSRSRSWVHVIGFTTLMTIAVYVIFDLEYPRLGLIRLDAVDHLLVDVREGMK